jgi:hypothetical protein
MTAAAQPQELLVRLLDPSNRADPYPAYAARYNFPRST